MAEYDLRRMQEEAVRRAREMQSRARFPHPPGGGPGRGKAAPPEKSPLPSAEPSPKEEEGALAALFQDKERTVILALVLLLSQEEGHEDLLFALLFLLL